MSHALQELVGQFDLSITASSASMVGFLLRCHRDRPGVLPPLRGDDGGGLLPSVRTLLDYQAEGYADLYRAAGEVRSSHV